MLHGMLPSQRRLRRRHGSQACLARWRFCEGGLESLCISVELVETPARSMSVTAIHGVAAMGEGSLSRIA
jgi:hypothetical protein